jgi:hypothetical protein
MWLLRDYADWRLLLLYNLSFFISVEKCVLSEELKILLHDRKLAELDRVERDEEKMA